MRIVRTALSGDLPQENMRTKQRSRTHKPTGPKTGRTSGLLAECQPTAEHAYTSSNVLLQDTRIFDLRGKMNALGQWSDELETMLKTVISNVQPPAQQVFIGESI